MTTKNAAENPGQDLATEESAFNTPSPRRPYVAPRLERKRAVERVTLLSGMGAMGVGVVNMMN